ncbi:MAG: response regulator [Afipia sp.]|jgi:two-component system, LuxR family, response regulator FixJ|nr:response regulator [Afipia sp.]MBX9823257.1 response regulator [Afipia birgiae]
MASPVTKSRICVVDDDLDVLSSLRFLLETEGFDVRTFRSGAAMLDAAVTEQFDCFVLDFKMPNMSGIAIANRLRDRNVSAPIILITGYPDESIRTNATVAGINLVLFKPDAEESLASQIRAAVQRNSHAGQRLR